MTDKASGAPDPIRILFVCTGNICRSPLAEGIAGHRARDRGLGARVSVDSAGTDAWHVGEGPDSRSVEVAARNGVTLGGVARRVDDRDLHEFDVIVAMDRSHLRHLQRMKDRTGAEVDLVLMRDFDPDPGDREVPDPYYGGPDGFDLIFEMIDRATDGLLNHLTDGGDP